MTSTRSISGSTRLRSIDLRRARPVTFRHGVGALKPVPPRIREELIMPLLQSEQLDSLLVYRHGGPASLSDLALGKASPCCVCANVIDSEKNQQVLGIDVHRCANENCNSRYCCMCYDVFTVRCEECERNFCFYECADFYHDEDGCLCRECRGTGSEYSSESDVDESGEGDTSESDEEGGGGG